MQATLRAHVSRASARPTAAPAPRCPVLLQRRRAALLPTPQHPSVAPGTLTLPRASAFDTVLGELADAARPAANEAIEANAGSPQAITTYILAIGFLALLVGIFLIPLGGFFASKGK